MTPGNIIEPYFQSDANFSYTSASFIVFHTIQALQTSNNAIHSVLLGAVAHHHDGSVEQLGRTILQVTRGYKTKYK